MKKLIKIKNRVAELWSAETPKLAKFCQILSGAIGAGALYWSQLPDEWKSAIPPEWLKVVSAVGFVLVILLQFTKKKQ